MQPQGSARPLAWALILVLVAYVFLAWPGVRGPFLFDDFPNLAALSKFGVIDTWREVGQYFSESRFFPGRPLAMLTFLAQQSAWPGNPQPFKIANLALHLVNAALVFALFARLATAIGQVPDRARLIAATGAIVWLVMPAHLSTVFLVVQRMTLLATTFMLAGLLAYLHGVLSTHASTRVRAAWMGLGLGGGTLFAVLCKENGALLPMLALAIDTTILRGAAAALPAPLRAWRRVLQVPATLAVVAFLLWNLRGGGDDPIGYRDFTLRERLLTEPRVLLDYLHGTVLPSYSRYSVYHDDFPVSRGLLEPWTTLPALLLLLGAVAAAFAWRRSHPLPAFAVFWFVGGHLLEAGPLPLELYFEHRNYLPIIGPVFAIVAGAFALPDGTARKAAGALGGIWLLGSLLAVALYAGVWSSPTRLAYFWASAHPASVRAQTEYARILFERGQLGDARKVMAALAARSSDPAPALTVLMLDCLSGEANAAQVDALRRRLRTTALSRGTVQAVGELRAVAVGSRCDAVDDAAWLALSDALLANPAYAERVAAGSLRYQRHELAVARGQLDRAIAELDAVAERDPDPEIVRLQARYLVEAGLVDDAIARLEGYDGSSRSRLRRLLVDDAAINREMIVQLRERKARGPGDGVRR